MFTREVLKIDPAHETERIVGFIREVLARMKKRGAVVALSGGVDSSLVGALLVQALGKDRVFGLLLPEKESSEETRRLGDLIVAHLGIRHAVEDISPLLEAAGCYRRRDEAIRSAIPRYGAGWRSKVVLPPAHESDRFRISEVVARAPDGEEVRVRLGAAGYLALVAATNFKQRCRKMLEYHHADRLAYAVAGTPNLAEYDLGFFVKLGDGAADLKPIAHLYKTQVYALAEHLGVPEEIRRRPPTTDTYSLEQTQEEFYFSLPYALTDLCLYARRHLIGEVEAAPVLGLTVEEVRRVFRDLDGKGAVARTLHLEPQVVEPSIRF
jgi:NAD+ synthase